jgi:ABC-2 type transport system permease protein
MTCRLRSAFVIARRDFRATVLSKAFLFFLLGPLFPLLLGGAFGSIGARVASRTERPVVAVVMPRSQAAQIAAARARLAQALGDEAVVKLVYYDPRPDMATFEKQLLHSSDPPIRAVLSGWLGSPHVGGDIRADDSTARQLDLILRDAITPRLMAPPLHVEPARTSPASLAKDRALTGQIGQMLLFFLTILLSGMLLSQLIEEKSNKIIEVIAAAVPIDSLFVGKLFAMLAASVVGIIVWLGAGALLIQFMTTGGVQTLPPPAVGWTGFLLLAIAYFGMNYLLLGAVFLTIGAQASTVREVQTMSLPVTFAQVVIFGFAATAIGSPDTPEALAAAVFPLSSPMVMLARAAERPEWWPHAAALAWQALWVVLILKVGARLFRKSVLKSGPRTRRWQWLRRSASVVGEIGSQA